MRVRGSFYLAKGKGGFGTGKSKSPRGAGKKPSPSGRLGLPKKKAKLKLEPIGPRNIGVRASGSGVNKQIDEVEGEQLMMDPIRVRDRGHFTLTCVLCVFR